MVPVVSIWTIYTKLAILSVAYKCFKSKSETLKKFCSKAVKEPNDNIQNE